MIRDYYMAGVLLAEKTAGLKDKLTQFVDEAGYGFHKLKNSAGDLEFDIINADEFLSPVKQKINNKVVQDLFGDYYKMKTDSAMAAFQHVPKKKDNIVRKVRWK